MQELEQWIQVDLARSTEPLNNLMRRVSTFWQQARRAQKAGDLTTLSNCFTQLRGLVRQIGPYVEDSATSVNVYDVREYLDEQFDREFREACAAANLPLEGQFPRYLVYPLRIHIDRARTGVLINRKLYRGLRPAYIIESIGAERTRLMRRPFSARYFLADLASLYDSIIELESAKNRVDMSGHEVSLRQAYRRLVPMRQWRTDYPETFFAFDIHRLLTSNESHAPDGRRLQLAPAHQARNNLAVLDASGREVQYGLMAFRKE